MTGADENKGPRASDGRYADVFRIGHDRFDFFIEFGQLPTEGGSATYHTRIITNPKYAKLLSGLLLRSIDRYEHAFDRIADDEDDEDDDNGENGKPATLADDP